MKWCGCGFDARLVHGGGWRASECDGGVCRRERERERLGGGMRGEVSDAGDGGRYERRERGPPFAFGCKRANRFLEVKEERER